MILPGLWLAAALAGSAAAAPVQAPIDGVVFIVVDALRQDRLSAYGNPRKTSPALDALAGAGALFLNAEAASNWTLPALASIMTSLDPAVHGAQRPPRGRPGWPKELEEGRFRAARGGKLDASRPTLARALSRAGWTTAGIVSGGFCQSAFGFDSGFGSYRDTGVKLEELNDKYILPWIKARRREKFFLYVHAGDVHDPYDTTPRYNHLWDPDYRGTIDGSRATLDAVNEGRRALTPRDLEHLRALYDGGISYTDAQIARILAALKALGRDRRTLVVVTSDHGESFREHGTIMQHGRSAYETELRVPLIMKVPGRKPGVRVTSVISALDIAPTVLDALGVAAPAGFEGRSALGRLDGAAKDEAEAPAFSETSGLFVSTTSFAVRDGAWKLIRGGGGADLELYDLASDPGEKTDLARTRPEVALRLSRLLDGRIERDAAAFAALPALSTAAASAPGLDEKLRAEGYLK
jgi:arylsulfatase A-like enzyme